MPRLIDHGLIRELVRFQYRDGGLRDATINGVNEIQSEDGYLYNVLEPLFNTFFIEELPKKISIAIKNHKKEAIVDELKIIVTKIDSVIQEREGNLTIRDWGTELSFLDLGNYENRERYHVLRFFIGAVKVQKSIAYQTKRKIEKIIDAFTFRNVETEPSTGTRADVMEPKRTGFKLTKTYSLAKNKHIIGDLRNDLLDNGYLTKEDINNTAANFKRMFVDHTANPTKVAALPIKWLGNQTELKYFIHVLANVLIEPDYSSESNYFLAFKFFVDSAGKTFKPTEIRFKDKPKQSSVEKIDGILQSLKLSDTSK